MRHKPRAETNVGKAVDFEMPGYATTTQGEGCGAKDKETSAVFGTLRRSQRRFNVSGTEYLNPERNGIKNQLLTKK